MVLFVAAHLRPMAFELEERFVGGSNQLCKFNRLNSVMQIMQIQSGSIQLCKFNRARIHDANYANSIGLNSIMQIMQIQSGSIQLRNANAIGPESIMQIMKIQ